MAARRARSIEVDTLPPSSKQRLTEVAAILVIGSARMRGRQTVGATNRSAKIRGWLRAMPDQCEKLQRAIDAAKRDGFAKIESLAAAAQSSGARCPALLTIRYHDLLADPITR